MDILYKTFPSQNKHIYERYLCFTQQNYKSEFETLLENANEKLIHQKCIEIYIFKFLNDLSSDIMNNIFKLRQNTYELKNLHTFESQNPRTKKFGLDRT